MPQERYPRQTTGETLGPDQDPVTAGERDDTQRDQERREGSPPLRDPRKPDAEEEDSLMARSPDRIYGREESESGSARAGMPSSGAENLPPKG